MDLGIAGRAALVCGASQGLGRAAAEALASEGARVAVVARRADTTRAVAEELARSFGHETHAISADLVEPGACERAVDEAARRFDGLEILVANVGGPTPGSIDEVTDDDWRRAFELTFLTTVRLARAAIPHMQKAGWGRIVLIGSSAMLTPIPALALSSGVRTGLRGVIRLLAERYAKDGILVNVVCPGYIATERLTELTRAAGGSGQGDAEAYKRWASEIPLGRLGRPDELASVIAFLCSERASYVTGARVVVDGGRDRSL